ncbi:XdhC family protein [Luteithermobacter gelatinilyticus]|uniref:XdhC family protein n=1 Tax=Luteithermobacter gelatinilyticus TaxID=2582913 RepID=UPI001AF0137C|nr:XdhC/CoxI family protein [Luteithermobacter gelatinilyticus]
MMLFDLHDKIWAWLEAPQRLALATVIEVSSSSPRPPGSRMLIRETGEFIGSVSAGCVEGAVMAEVTDVLEQGRAKRLRFGPDGDMAWTVGLPCGGAVEIFLQPLIPAVDYPLFRTLEDHLRERTPCLLMTDLATGAQRLQDTPLRDRNNYKAMPALLEKVEAAMKSGHCQLVEEGPQRIFLHPILPRRRLIIIGAVHIAEYLAGMAALAGYEVIILDPRPAYLREDLFPDALLCADWPDEGLDRHRVDARTAVVALTHDEKLDDAALLRALETPAFYIGALGSRRTQEKRLARLVAAGVSSPELARLSGPVGLDIGATGPREIAVSILAEMVAASYGRKRPASRSLSAGIEKLFARQSPVKKIMEEEA